MLKLRISLEYGCFPVWIIDNGDIIDNALPESILNDLRIVSLFTSIQKEYESLFINNSIEFKYIGFVDNDLKNKFIYKVEEAIKLLTAKIKDLYIIEDWFNKYQKDSF